MNLQWNEEDNEGSQKHESKNIRENEASENPSPMKKTKK